MVTTTIKRYDVTHLSIEDGSVKKFKMSACEKELLSKAINSKEGRKFRTQFLVHYKQSPIH